MKKVRGTKKTINLEIIHLNIKFLRGQKKLTQEEFADFVGIKRSSVGAYEEGRAKPTNKTLLIISERFNISVDRLLREDLSKTADASIFVGGAQSHSSDSTTTASGNEKLKVLAITVGEDGKENIELVPEKASAGYTKGYADPNYLETLPKFRLPFLSAGTYRAFEIIGDSMLPLTPGTIVIGEYVENVQDIKNGQTYIILSESEGIVYKRVFNNIASNGNLHMISDNDSYKSYYLNASDVKEIWRAKAFISKDLPSNESNIHNLTTMVFELQAQLNDLKRKIGDA
jgi:transcriptional regulator with XRE-family HTH domain